MEYTIQELAQLSGVSTRTLRYYDEIGLLKPARTNEAGYRFYGQWEVDMLRPDFILPCFGYEISDNSGYYSSTKLSAC